MNIKPRTSLIAAILGLVLGIAYPAARAQHVDDADSPLANDQIAIAPVSSAEVNRLVNAYLSIIDTPISISEWRALGPRALPVLRAVIDDHSAPPSRRAH